MMSEPRLETERKPVTGRHRAGGRTSTCRGTEGRRTLGPSRKERAAGLAGEDRAGRAGQGDMGAVAETMPDYTEPLAVTVMTGFILNVVSNHQRGGNDLMHIPKRCSGFVGTSEAEEKSDQGPCHCPNKE